MKCTKALTNLLTNWEQTDKFSGVVLITKGKKVFSGAYGYANRSWNIKNTMDVRFDTASLTKLFTAVSTLQLIDQGYIAFDTKVTTLGLKTTTISDNVTVYHLLTHTSGIGDDCEEEAGEVYEDLWKNTPNYSITDTADFLPQFIHKEPNFAPGEGCRYCNVGFILLGLLIEKVTHMRYRDYVRKNIFSRAGMHHTDFLWMDYVYKNVAEGYAPVKDNKIRWRKNIYSYPPIGSPDSGAYTTAGDVDIFLRSLQAGTLLSDELTQDILTPKVLYWENEEFTCKYGYGFLFVLDKDDNIIFYGGGGVNTGISCKMNYYPGHDINVIILANQEGAWELAWEIHDVLTAHDFL